MIASKRPRATSAVGLGKSPLLRCSWCILDVIMSVHIYKKKEGCSLPTISIGSVVVQVRLVD